MPSQKTLMLLGPIIITYKATIRLPSTQRCIVGLYDAGMFAAYLIILAWGIPKNGSGDETSG
jgi:hypothetical protein